jgi:hypothetical protein
VPDLPALVEPARAVPRDQPVVHGDKAENSRQRGIIEPDEVWIR